MANLKMAVVEILDNDDDVDIEFLSHIEAAEAQALSLSSSKRRRVTLPSSPSLPSALVDSAAVKVKSERENDKSGEEGAYTAALRGSKSLTWQMQTQLQSHTPPPPRAGGGACFKCGKEGHWARDCDQSSSSSVAAPPSMAGVEKGCPCGMGSCVVLTANTERNRGRKFFKCPVRQENGGCGFFEWCDESTANGTSAEERAWNNGGPQRFYQQPANQGTSGFAKPWNDYDDKGTSSVNSSRGAVQKFKTTDNKGYNMRTGSSCFKCGEEGHWARDCSAPSHNATNAVRGKTSSDTCYKCGGSGHWAKDCTQGQSMKHHN